MSRLDEFNESISSLQREVENLQAIEQAYKQLAKLVQDYDIVLANLNTATEDMTSTKGELVKQTTSVSEKLIEQKKVLETATNEQRKELEAKLKNIQALVEEKQNELQTLLNVKTDDISEANKRFYNDFANTVQTRLDNNKMEIKQLIDQDSMSARQQMNDLKHEIKEHTANISLQLATQKKVSRAFGIVVTILLMTLIVLTFLYNIT